MDVEKTERCRGSARGKANTGETAAFICFFDSVTNHQVLSDGKQFVFVICANAVMIKKIISDWTNIELLLSVVLASRFSCFSWVALKIRWFSGRACDLSRVSGFFKTWPCCVGALITRELMCWASLLQHLVLAEKREHTVPSGPVIYRMANRRAAFSTQPHSRCLPQYNLYKRQIEFIAMSLAPQPEP